MTTTKTPTQRKDAGVTLAVKARSLRARIARADATACDAHKQMALRRIGSALLFADKNPEYAMSQLEQAEYHAQFILQ
jgi:hypothetical protein